MAQEPIDDARLAAAGRVLSALHLQDALRINRGDPAGMDLELRATCAEQHVAKWRCDQLIGANNERLSAAVRNRDAAMPEILAAMRTAYATRFSAQELNAIADFYQSPVGQKVIATRPELEAELKRVLGAIAIHTLVGGPGWEPKQ